MKFFPENVDVSLCTHVIYAFAKIGKGHVLESVEKNDNEMYQKFNQIKKVKYYFQIQMMSSLS